ncbi:hypothetical protein [Sphingobacterium thalpophilum]|uniref:Uncharacterized protein n=1 Tax=Sphingobacterium thalpophilum TaxID=259 RepID=A0A4U9VC76_9SPHI|nr:hypothetical protein [Sphingobacterium thalpophilum]VTR43643.1 Uncharacterised protein [Sphingobacterium thalpophilum]
MKKIDNLSDLLLLHEIIEKSKVLQDIRYENGSLEIELKEDISAITSDLQSSNIDFDKSGSKIIEINIDKSQILFFQNKDTFYDRVCSNNLSLDGRDIFIWDYDKTCILYENFSKERAANDETKNGGFILNVVQYRDLLNIFLDIKNQLIELEKAHPQNELFFASKGDDNLLVKINYQKKVDELYNRKFEYLNIDKFLERINNQEWLACFKNTICAFFDKQSDSKKTFFWLYENFEYLFANTEKSYFLYISKFSFDKISKLFKKDQEQYFNSLNDYQNKLSGQLISIPLTIGAALLSSNFVTNNGLANSFVVYLISAYVIFVMGTIGFVFFDLIKLKKDITDERDNFQKRYSNIYENFKQDFDYILCKSRWMIGFAVFLLVLFLSILLIVWIGPTEELKKDFILI